jgi:L-threonylcarbamoyladenylate synthase
VDADEWIAQATARLDAGEVVAIPLDGGEALAADALHETAALALREALGLPADAPLDVVVGGFEDLGHVAFATPLARRLADAFWPGTLAMRLRARPYVPDEVTAAGEHVAVRAPVDERTRALARHFGPIAVAPSAGSARVDATGEEAKVLRDGAPAAAEVEAVGRRGD